MNDHLLPLPDGSKHVCSFARANGRQRENQRKASRGQAGAFSSAPHFLHGPHRIQLPGILHHLKSSVIGLSASLLGVILPGSGAVTWAAEVKAVGYVNVDYRQGYQLIADPLRSRANRVDQVLPSVAENTQLAKFDGGNWVTNEFVAGSWTIPEMTLSPGEAAVLRSPAEWPHPWAGS